MKLWSIVGGCLLTAVMAVAPVQLLAAKQAKNDAEWQAVVEAARGEQVYFHAWGGSSAINNYLRWAQRELQRDYGIRLVHVKVADIAESVLLLRNEGQGASAIDLLWINGENFHTLKRGNQLATIYSDIPQTTAIATGSLPVMSDFGEPIDDLEVPWGLGQFNVLFREGSFSSSAITPAALLAFAQENPGRFSYPKPPEFHGTTFLKELLLELSDHDERLYAAANDAAQDDLLPQLWTYLDKLHPHLWQQGDNFVQSVSEQQQLLNDGVLSAAFSFNPNELTTAIAAGRLPPGIEQGTIGDKAITNSHYLAVPKNSQQQAAAKVVINFLLSEAAQRRKLDVDGWGDPSVLTSLQAEQQLVNAEQELHADWQAILEREWSARYER